MAHKDGRVSMTAWVDPVIRDYARAMAKREGIEFSRWVEKAVHRGIVVSSMKKNVQGRKP